MKKLYAITLLLSLLIFSGCKKDDDTNEPPPVDPGPIEVKENVKVVDQTLLALDTIQSDITNGVYVLTYTGTESNPVETGDIIVGEDGEGYIRRILSVSQAGNIITLTTEQATLEDVFKTGTFNFTNNLDGMMDGKTSGFSHSVSNQELYNNGGLKIDMISGTINLNPEFYFDFGFNLSGITKFEMSTTGSSFSADASIKATATQNATLFNESFILTSKTVRRIYYVPVPPPIFRIPIVTVINLKLLADYSANVNAAVTSTANFSTSSTVDLGMKYTVGQWIGIYNVSPVTALEITQPVANIGVTLNYAWRPNITVKINGVSGPYANILAPTCKIAGTVALPSLDWDLKSEAWLKTSVGADVSILGYTLATYGPVVWETEKLTYRRPDQIQRTSGDGQIADPNEALPQPIKVRILNSMGTGEGGVPVYFNVTSGGGSFNPESAITNASGYAQAYWTLGAQQFNTQFASVSAKYGDGSLINSAPIIFQANTTGLPVVSTFSASSITETTASTGGNVSNDGGSNVTARGVCWDTVPNPTTAVNAISNGSGEGSFTSNLTNLTAGETYFVKAYATNSIGTVYGNQINFTTTAIDSVPIYTASALGNYRVNNYVGNGPNSELFCLLNSSGQAIYTIYNDPSWPDGTNWTMSWSIVFSNGRYYYLDNWWNGQNNISVDDPLTYPVTFFNYHDNTTYVMQ